MASLSCPHCGARLDLVIAAREETARIVRREATRLSPAEIETLRLVAEGCVNKEIARRRGVCLQTVKNAVHDAMGKLGATTRVGAVMAAIHEGLLESAQLRRENVRSTIDH